MIKRIIYQNQLYERIHLSRTIQDHPLFNDANFFGVFHLDSFHENLIHSDVVLQENLKVKLESEWEGDVLHLTLNGLPDTMKISAKRVVR